MSHIVKFHFDPQEHKLATRSLDHPPQCLHRGDGNPRREQEIGNHCEPKFPGTWSINVAHANLLLDLFTLPQFGDFVFPFSFCRFNKVASHCIPQIIAILCLWFFFFLWGFATLKWLDMCIQSWFQAISSISIWPAPSGGIISLRLLIESNITANCCQIGEQCALSYDANQFGMTMATVMYPPSLPPPSVHSEQEGELSFSSSIRIILDSWTFFKLLIARDRLGAPFNAIKCRSLSRTQDAALVSVRRAIKLVVDLIKLQQILIRHLEGCGIFKLFRKKLLTTSIKLSTFSTVSRWAPFNCEWKKICIYNKLRKLKPGLTGKYPVSWLEIH